MTEYVVCDLIYIKFKNSKTNRCCWRVVDFGGCIMTTKTQGWGRGLHGSCLDISVGHMGEVSW